MHASSCLTHGYTSYDCCSLKKRNHHHNKCMHNNMHFPELYYVVLICFLTKHTIYYVSGLNIQKHAYSGGFSAERRYGGNRICKGTKKE